MHGLHDCILCVVFDTCVISPHALHPPIIHHTSYIIHHTSYIIHHTSYMINL